MVETVKLLDPVSLLQQRRSGPLILELDLTQGLAEEAPADPLGKVLAKRHQQLRDVVEGIRRGAHDPRVKGLVAKIDGRAMGFAKVQEVRAAVASFRRAGKDTVAWAESYGEGGPGTVCYYLATAFAEVALVPTGLVGLTGISLGTTFLGGAAERLGVRMEGGARHEYKNAPNKFTETGYTEPHREITERLVASLTDQLAEGIAEARGLTPERVRELVDRGPFLATEALEAGLVDRLAYRDEVYADLRGRHGTDAGAGSGGAATGSGADAPGPAAPANSADADGASDGAAADTSAAALFSRTAGRLGRTRRPSDDGPTLMYVGRYRQRSAMPDRISARGGGYIAMITATGVITSGRSRRSALGGETMGADTVSAALRAARRDRNVRAVVFRVDSRGGSAVASDVIRREVALTREAGTPVVASLGDIAGSGGYYIVMDADAIVCRPGTLTGSIGVYTGKPVLSGLLERLGVNNESVDSGAHATMFAPERGFTDSEWERVNAMLDFCYDDFTAKVARARGLSAEQVDAVARGRVLSGRDAQAGGLIDDLGGLPAAVRLAREKAGLPGGRLRSFPVAGPWERLVPSESSEDRAAAPQSALGLSGDLADLAARAGLPGSAPLMMPGDWVIR